MTSDLDLLRQFAGENSQDAFTEIVRRHVNLVYSAALRQVRSPQLAEEIAQSVFADLARSGTGILPVNETNSLTPWLYAVTRRTAIDAIRKESRRQLREQIAVEMNDMNATANDWTQIEPLLDDAMAALDETDRSAILLRYFENKNLREVGESLKISDDAAQKRVSRAVEKLGEFFSKRKITIGAGGLVVLISANAVQSAPVGLAVTISAAALAGTAVSTSTVIAATKIIAMTTLQKTIIGATLAVVAGTGIFEARQNSKLQNQIQTLQQQQTPLTEEIQQLQQERDDATNQLAGLLAENSQLKSNLSENELLKLRGEVTQLRNEANDGTASTAKAWLEKVNKLKERLEENPNARIPEMQFLTEQDWLSAVSKKLENDADYRRDLADLRSAAESKFVGMYQQALQRYLNANNNQFPTDVSQLQSYFDPPIDEAILQRWKFIPANGNANQGFAGGDWVLTEKTPVDELFDSRYTIGLHGSGTTDFFTYSNEPTIALLQKAFFAANPPESLPPPHPPSASELLPYAMTPEQQAVVQQMVLRESALK
jgi:RNA polymerase sigma factor (sigma-70 family)